MEHFSWTFAIVGFIAGQILRIILNPEEDNDEQ